MRLFTFSGSSSLMSPGDTTMVQFAKQVIAALPGEKPRYEPGRNVGQFPSDISLGQLLGEFQDAVQHGGSSLCNREAVRLAPTCAQAMIKFMVADPTETVLCLANDQGCNNLVWTLLELARHEPKFFLNRSVRCALFDPKVSTELARDLITRFSESQLSFLFFQSQNDLLGNQPWSVPKFIGLFEFGNHIFLPGLDSRSILHWSKLKKLRPWLARSGYRDYSQAYKEKVAELRQPKGKTVLERKRPVNPQPLTIVHMMELNRWLTKYPMRRSIVSDALVGFLHERLPAQFRS